MRRRRMLGWLMIVIGVMWLSSQFVDNSWSHSNGRHHWRGDSGMHAMPPMPNMPDMPAMPAMPDMPMMHHHGHGGFHGFGWWKLPLLILGAALILGARRRRQPSNTSTATIYRF